MLMAQEGGSNEDHLFLPRPLLFFLFKSLMHGENLSVANSQYITETAAILQKAFRSGRGHPGGNE